LIWFATFLSRHNFQTRPKKKICSHKTKKCFNRINLHAAMNVKNCVCLRTLTFFKKNLLLSSNEEIYEDREYNLHICLTYLLFCHYFDFVVDNSGFRIRRLNGKWKLNLTELFMKVFKETSFGYKSKFSEKEMILNNTNNI
jgi:hypothetical protein